MGTELQKKEISEVLYIINRLLPLLDEAEKKFKSARNWGLVDIFGGGALIDFIKHTQINSASNRMSEIGVLLNDLQRELKDVSIPVDMQVNVGTFSTFADFLFDGFLADVYMQTKISKSLDGVRELKEKVQILQKNMIDLQSRY